MSAEAGTAPFIVTALLPPELARWATDLRTAHFPPERNFLKAHVTLFHALPYFCGDEARAALAQETAEHVPVEAELAGLMSLGGGTALKLSSPAMLDLRDRLAGRFHGLLTAQDSHRPRLHVTIQNKVTAKEAKALQAELAPQITPLRFRFSGLGLYIYRGGPWDHVRDYPFRGRPVAFRG
ncbi:2'-5' RNA ligase family protein [Allopontixanthobacter sp.]|uniref:2'-5' RNA ligase family protein n=1 Tax=Allopontixanthobacter sp. TaxID=2906452 RepID=UPI002ABA552B|nr:2'-5' RNA ligase family protein [Allopontixanthobacter sp.]MDZ4308177.1 2'-5' RNA ligase family protein [Allopontixanthobacter sp.]